MDRSNKLSTVGVDAFVIDELSGYSKNVMGILKYLKENYPQIDVLVTGIVTPEAATKFI